MSVNKKYKRGEIYLVKFHPSTGKEIKKFRPSVVVFDSQTSGFVTVAPLTSIINVHLPKLEYIITPSTINGLEEDSLLLGWYLRTIDDTLIQKFLGKLNKVDSIKLKTVLRNLLS